MQKERVNRQSTQIQVHQEASYREICTALGEKEANQKEGGDDDIEIVRNLSQQVSLKCTVTTMLLEEQLKNKVCGHVFSKKGIQQLLRGGSRQCKCPVAGCNNGNVSMAQLQKDQEMEFALRRERHCSKS